MKRIFLLLFIICISSSMSIAQSRSVNSEEARQIAEKFISCSGFTDKRLKSEKCGRYKVICSNNTFPCRFLERRAFGYFLKGQNDEDGWTIVFRKRGKLKSKTTGVKITMNLDGTGVKIEETKVFLRLVERRY